MVGVCYNQPRKTSPCPRPRPCLPGTWHRRCVGVTWMLGWLAFWRGEGQQVILVLSWLQRWRLLGLVLEASSLWRRPWYLVWHRWGPGRKLVLQRRWCMRGVVVGPLPMPELRLKTLVCLFGLSGGGIIHRYSLGTFWFQLVSVFGHALFLGIYLGGEFTIPPRREHARAQHHYLPDCRRAPTLVRTDATTILSEKDDLVNKLGQQTAL